MSVAKAEQKLPSWLPLLSAIVATVLILMLAYNMAMQKTGGALIYALDDAYIHLTVAKNFHTSGVWGITPTTPASASSSPLWTLILSTLDSLPIDPLVIPLILNLLLAVALVVVIYRFSRGFAPWARAGLAFLFVFGLPGTAIFLSGMENLLHAFLTFLFIGTLVLVPRSEKSLNLLITVAFIGLLMMLTRYESIFLFLVPAAWGIYRRQPILLAPLVGAAAGAVIFGIVSERAGMPFVPNTILLKSDIGDAKSLAGFLGATLFRAKWNLLQAPTVVAVGVTGILALASQWKSSTKTRLATVTVITAFVLHVAFSFTRQLFRYEVYLVAAMAITILFGIRPKEARSSFSTVALSLFALALLYRGALAMVQAPEAVQNINDQQFQMATFLAKYYPGKNIALNDIGVVSYYGHVNIIDLFGLANKDILKLKQAGQFNTQAIADIVETNNVDAGILFPGWFEQYGGLPAKDLAPVALWQMEEPNIVCAYDRVTFVAPLSKVAQLHKDLNAFRPYLPRSVKVTNFKLTE